MVFLYFFIPVSVSILAYMLTCSQFQLNYWLSSYDLTVVVLSSRDHYIQRQSIRETWFNSSYHVSGSVKTVFAVGDPCPVHPNDRVDMYGCSEWNINVIDITDDVLDGWTIGGPSPVTTEYKFSVLHPLVLTELTLHRSCLSTDLVKVALYDRVADEEITFANFTSDQDTSNVLLTSTLAAPFTLPKGFEGMVVVEGDTACGGMGPTNAAIHCSSLLNCVDEKGSPAVGLRFHVNDRESLKEHINGRDSRRISWHALQSKHANSLMKEEELYKDIISVDTIDVYRNLPDKLLQAIQWISASVNTRYLLKTDDDCYVNISQIMHVIKESENVDKLWMGNFRKLWALDDYGKWAEHTYTGLTYPWFACGSGYIISADLINWISSNADHLHRFQGEDISMGIWLSPLNVNYIHNEEFSCVYQNVDSDIPHLTIPELTPVEIKSYHNKTR